MAGLLCVLKYRLEDARAENHTVWTLQNAELCRYRRGDPRSCDAIYQGRFFPQEQSVLQGGSVGLEHLKGVICAAVSAMQRPLAEEL